MSLSTQKVIFHTYASLPEGTCQRQTPKPAVNISHMLHGAGTFAYIWANCGVNVGKYSSTMEHLGMARQKQMFPAVQFSAGLMFSQLWHHSHAVCSTGIHNMI